MFDEMSELQAEAVRLRTVNESMELGLLRDQVRRLRAENARLAARLNGERGAAADARHAATTHAQIGAGSGTAGNNRAAVQPSSRREILGKVGTLAGLAVIGGAVASGSSVTPAAAANEPFLAGAVNVTDQTTEVRYNFPVRPAGAGNPRSHVFAAQDGAWGAQVPPAFSDDNGTRAAVAGYAGNDAILGGFFQTNSTAVGSAGLRSIGETSAAYGLRTQGRKAAILIDRYPSQPAAPDRLDLHVGGEIIHDSVGDLWFCVSGGAPGSWRKLSGPATSGQTHLLAVPVRCYDSREGSAPLGVVKGLVTAPRLIDCRVVSGGGPAVVPADATGLVVNVTVTDTTADGWVAAYPGGSTYSGTSLLNFAAGQTIANSTSIGCGAGATLTVRCGGGGAGNIVIDVMGFYR